MIFKNSYCLTYIFVIANSDIKLTPSKVVFGKILPLYTQTVVTLKSMYCKVARKQVYM